MSSDNFAPSLIKEDSRDSELNGNSNISNSNHTLIGSQIRSDGLATPSSPEKLEIFERLFGLGTGINYDTEVKKVRDSSAVKLEEAKKSTAENFKNLEELIDTVKKNSAEFRQVSERLRDNHDTALKALENRYNLELRKLKKDYAESEKVIRNSLYSQDSELQEKIEKIDLNQAELESVKLQLTRILQNSTNENILLDEAEELKQTLEQIEKKMQETKIVPQVMDIEFTPSEDTGSIGSLSVNRNWEMIDLCDCQTDRNNLNYICDREVNEKIVFLHVFDNAVFLATSKQLVCLSFFDDSDKMKTIWSGQVQQLVHDGRGLIIIDGENHTVFKLRETQHERREILVCQSTKPYGISYEHKNALLLITDIEENTVFCFDDEGLKWKIKSSEEKHVGPSDIACSEDVAVVRSKQNLSIISLTDGTYKKTIETSATISCNLSYFGEFFIYEKKENVLSLYDNNLNRSRLLLTRDDHLRGKVTIARDFISKKIYAFRKMSKKLKVFDMALKD